ncbi:MAG: hypothetical protein U0746_20525 [Gemmataceae bacterium]
MLERPELWVVTAPVGWLVCDADGQSPLGRVTLTRDPHWLGARPRRLDATEGADGSLVFSAHRRWLGRTWTVEESEGNPVAWLRGGQVLTADNRLLGRYFKTANDTGRCRGWDGSNWAAWSADRGRIRLCFGDAVHDEPFLKMIAMASVLIA